MEKLKPIIAEWFANLPKGYATQPYSPDEINLLKIIITEAEDLTPDEKDALIKHADKMDVEEEPTDSAPEEKQDRFIAKSAPFIQSANAFIEFIKSEYTNPGIDIVGLEDLFNDIIILDADNFSSIVKLMAKHTNRQVEYGTFKMGQYELKLAELLHKNIKFDNASPLNLLLAIIYNGKLFTTVSNEISSIAVSVAGIKLIKSENAEGFITISTLTPELAESFKTIQTLNSIIHDNSSEDTLTMNDLSTILNSLQDGSLDSDIADLVKQGATTKIPSVKLLAGKLEQMLQGKSPRIIFESFKNLYNSAILKFSGEYSKIFDVQNNKIVIESLSDIAKKLLMKDVVPPTVQLTSNSIKIDSRLLNFSNTDTEKE